MKKDILKKIIACVCIAGLIMAGAGCKKDKENTDVEATPTPGAEQQETIEEGIEDGGEIDDEGNIIESGDIVINNSEKETESSELQASDGAADQNESAGNANAENANSGNVTGNTNSSNANSSNINGTTIAIPKVELKYGDDGNITKDCAVELLQKYTAEQLGLTPNISHQLLFDANGATVDGKKCYAIAAKVPGKETEGVFYVALDGSNVYKYDLANQLYITMP